MSRIADPEQAHGAALVVQAQRDVLDRLRAQEPERSVQHAHRMRLLAELMGLAPRSAHAILEVSGLFRIGQQRAHTMLLDAQRLVELFPTVCG